MKKDINEEHVPLAGQLNFINFLAEFNREVDSATQRGEVMEIKRKEMIADEKRMCIFAIDYLMQHEMYLNDRDIKALNGAKEILGGMVND